MPIVGLDLGSHSIRAVELEESKGGILLKRFGSYESPKLDYSSVSKQDQNTYADAVKHFFKEVDFSTPEVISAIPEYDVFTRVIKLPQMTEKELESSIAYEAEQFIPIPVGEVNFDFQILDPDVHDKDKMNVLIVAAKNEVLERQVALLKSAGLVPKGLEPETIAVGRVLGDTSDRPSASIIVNIGSFSTQIIIFYKGFVRFTRSISVGGDALTRAVAQSLNFEISQAEEYKKSYGMDQNQADGKVLEAMRPVFDNVLMEIKRARIFYTTHNPNVNINRVILSGGTALMPGLLFYMANNLSLEVELANPWRNIRFSKDLEPQRDLLTEQSPFYATAVGLALKEFI